MPRTQLVWTPGRLDASLVLTNPVPSRFPPKHLSVGRLIRLDQRVQCPNRSLPELSLRRPMEMDIPRPRLIPVLSAEKPTIMTEGRATSLPGRDSESAFPVSNVDGGNCRVTEVTHVSDVSSPALQTGAHMRPGQDSRCRRSLPAFLSLNTMAACRYLMTTLSARTASGTLTASAGWRLR